MKVLLVGDFARHSGFAKILEAQAAELAARGGDIAVLAVNYKGDPHPLQQQYRLYPAGAQGDPLGRNRLVPLVLQEEPDVVYIVSDPWVVPMYLDRLKSLEPMPPTVAYMPVDAPDVSPSACPGLERLTTAIAYTQFGADELRRVAPGLRDIAVLPHGIDLAEFWPEDRAIARQQLGIDPAWHCTLLLDRNQPRKALDLAIDGYALWLDRRRRAGLPIDHLRLLYHGALTDAGWPLEQFVQDVGLQEHFIATNRDLRPLSGLPAHWLRRIYSACDVRLSTTLGEGWGLTIMEALACGLPVIAPRYSALAEWADGCFYALPIVTTRRHMEVLTRVGVTSPEAVADALGRLSADDAAPIRAHLRTRGLALVNQARFRWSAIGDDLHAILLAAAMPEPDALPAPTFRPDTIDAWVWRQVVDHDEYQIGPLRADDRVIDIGAHIGAFAYAAWQHGSRRVVAYEVDAENAAIAARHVPGALVIPRAVWRTDTPPHLALSYTGHDGRNTGAGNVVFGDGERRPVSWVSIDAVIGDEGVALLKIDAESAEWPILLTCTKLDQVQRIVGEYHEVGGPWDQNPMTPALRVGDAERYTAADLRMFLEAQGFRVTIRPYTVAGRPSNLGVFDARREGGAHAP